MIADPIPIKFGPWLPDLPARDNPGTLLAKNVIPQIADTYRSLKSLSAFSDALDDVCLGTFWAQDAANTVTNFAGDETKLYRLDAGVSWVDESGTSAPYSAANWEFTKFGERVIAVNDQDNPQYWDLGTSSAFADLPGSPPPAERIGTIRDFVVLGDIPSLGPNYLKWSGYNNSEIWTPSLATQSDENELRGRGGRIQRIVPGAVGHIFQEHSVWRMTYEGPPRIFRFDEIERRRGTPAGNSVVWLGGMIFYYGWDDFYLFNGGESIPIGANRVANWFKQNVSDDVIDSMRGAVDRRNRLVMWAFKSSSSAAINNRLIIYNWAAKKWSYAEIDTQVIAEYVSAGFTLDELDTPLSSGIDIDSIPMESTQYLGGVLGLQAFDSSNQAATFSGAALQATIDTKELGGGSRRTIVNGIRPMVEADGNTTITVALGTRDSLNASTSYSVARSLNARSGIADIRANARYLRARVVINGDFDHASGVEAGAGMLGGGL